MQMSKAAKGDALVSLGKIERQSMHDQVYAKMKQALMEAKFEPGTRLSLRNLAKMFGVSVVPVRAALLRLMAEKAIVQAAITTGHFYVPQLSADEFEEIIELRALLEGRAAELAAPIIDKKISAKLRKMAQKLQVAANEDDATAYLRLNRDFKFAVIDAAKSPILKELIESLWIRVGPVMHFYAQDMKQQQYADNYFAIADALADGDGTAAAKAMADDVRLGATFLRDVAEFAE